MASSKKFEADAAFRVGRYQDAITGYTAAIVIAQNAQENDNELLYALYCNRSAAYTALNSPESAESALDDANAALQLNSAHWKAYSRKGTALLLLNRPADAKIAFSNGLLLQPDNVIMTDGLAAANNALSKDEIVDQMGSISSITPPSVPVPKEARLPPTQDDSIESFLHEMDQISQTQQTIMHKPVQEPTTGQQPSAARKPSSLVAALLSQDKTTTEIVLNKWASETNEEDEERKKEIALVSTGKEYELTGEEAKAQSARLIVQYLGNSDEQVERLTGKFSKWLNLNPFEVLQLPYSCNEDDIKARYRKLSTLVHPDKSSHPRASDAFQAVKNASEVLSDPNKRRISAGIIANITKQVLSSQKRKAEQAKKEGMFHIAIRSAEDAHETQETISAAVKKAFAEVEFRKIQFETRVKEMAEREAKEELERFAEEVEEAKKDKEWNEKREERMKKWHSFAAGIKRPRKPDGTTPIEVPNAFDSDSTTHQEGEEDVVTAAFRALEEETGGKEGIMGAEGGVGAIFAGGTGVRMTDRMKYGAVRTAADNTRGFDPNYHKRRWR